MVNLVQKIYISYEFTESMIKFAVFGLLFVNFCVKSKADNSKVKSSTQPIQCPGFNETVYECHTGYCCDKDACCPHYYELWWFWLIWVVTILLAFCCAYHQKRKRPFQSTPLYPTTDTPDLYAGACNYPGPPADKKQEMLGYTKLPIYDDVIRVPPSASPPPPYSSGRQPVNTVAYVQKEKKWNIIASGTVQCNKFHVITSFTFSLHTRHIDQKQHQHAHSVQRITDVNRSEQQPIALQLQNRKRNEHYDVTIVHHHAQRRRHKQRGLVVTGDVSRPSRGNPRQQDRAQSDDRGTFPQRRLGLDVRLQRRLDAAWQPRGRRPQQQQPAGR